MNVTLLWDIDGTIISTAKGKASGLFPEAVAKVLHKEVEAVVSDGEGRPDLEILALTFEQAGVAPTLAQLSAAVEALNDISPQSLYEQERQLLEGATETLSLFAERGMTQAVITGNTRAKALAKLNAFGLAGYFDFSRSAFGDEARTRAETVGIAVSRNAGNGLVCIGDTPNDIQAAQANEIPVIAVATGDFDAGELATYEPTALVTSATEIITALEQILCMTEHS